MIIKICFAMYVAFVGLAFGASIVMLLHSRGPEDVLIFSTMLVGAITNGYFIFRYWTDCE